MYKPLSGWTQKRLRRKNVNTDATGSTRFLSVPLPVARHDPRPVTWHDFTSRNQYWKILEHFFQASYRPHGSPTVSYNPQLRRTREKGRDGYTHTHRQLWIPHCLSTETHTPIQALSHPAVIVYHTTTPTPRQQHTVPGQQFSLVWRTAARQQKTEIEKVMRQWAQLEILERDLGQCQHQTIVWRWNGKWGKVSIKRRIYHQTERHFLLGRLST